MVAVDKIGDAGKKIGASLQQAGNAGTQALKQMGNEAEKTAKKISEINNSVKGIKIGQAIGFANQIVNSDSAKTIGKYAGKKMGMADDSMSFLGGYASAILGGAATGAGIGAMVGAPVMGVGAGIGAGIGAAAGALTAGASYLMKSAIELEESSKELKEAAKARSKETIERNQKNLQNIKEAESENKRIGGYTAKVQELVAAGKYDEAEKLLNEQEKGAKGRLKVANFNLSQKSTQLIEESFNENLVNRTNAQNELAGISRLRGMIAGTKDREEARAKAQTEARSKTIAGIRQEDKLNAEIKDLEGQVKNGSEEKYIQIRDALAKAMEDAKDEMEKSTEDQEAFAAAQEKLADATRKYAAVQAARKEVVDKEKQSEKEKNQNWLNEVQDQANNLKNSISGMGNMKLTDSLTQIGGGGGYGAQMTGISNYVGKVVNEIKKLEQTAEEIKNIMKNNESGGVFTSESE